MNELTTITESESEDVKHGDVEGQRERTVQHAAMKSVKIVCSCGSTRCYAIDRFGLPAPLFVSDVEPLGPQHVRDIRALAVKQSLG